MATSIWIVADLLPLAALAVFVVAAAAEPAARLWRRVEPVSRREPRHAQGSRA
jgi:hypothetical protein